MYPPKLHIPLRLAICFCLVAGPVFALNEPSIAVLPLRGRAGHTATQGLVDAFAKNKRVIVASHTEVVRFIGKSEGDPDQSRKNVEEASQLLSEAKDAYHKTLEIKTAEEKLQRAQVKFRQSLDDEQAFEGLRATKFYLAMIFLAQKEEGRAKQELREIYVQDPERNTRKVSTKLYPPEVDALFQRVREELKSEPAAHVVISTAPEGATVFLNGRSVGVSPLEVGQLPVGEHHLRIEVPGFRPYEEFKYFSAGRNEVSFDANSLGLDKVREFHVVEAKDSLLHPVVRYLDEMALRVGVDIFVFLSPGTGQVKGQLFDQRSQELSEVVVARTPEDLVGQLMGYIDGRGYVIPRATTKRPSGVASMAEESPTFMPRGASKLEPYKATLPEKQQKSFVEKPVVWIAAGVVLLGLGAGGYFLFRGSSQQSSNLILEIP